jgi:hypothetical protein
MGPPNKKRGPGRGRAPKARSSAVDERDYTQKPLRKQGRGRSGYRRPTSKLLRLALRSQQP